MRLDEPLVGSNNKCLSFISFNHNLTSALSRNSPFSFTYVFYGIFYIYFRLDIYLATYNTDSLFKVNQNLIQKNEFTCNYRCLHAIFEYCWNTETYFKNYIQIRGRKQILIIILLHKPPKPLCGSGVVDMTAVKISDRDRFGIEFPGTMWSVIRPPFNDNPSKYLLSPPLLSTVLSGRF